MSTTYRQRCVVCVIWCVLLAASLGFSLPGCNRKQKSNVSGNANSQERRSRIGTLRQKQVGESGEISMMVDPGEKEKGFDYYFTTFCELGLTNDGRCTPGPSPSPTPTSDEKEAVVVARALDLAQTLQFLGYNGLTPRELEDTSSKDLMSRFPDDLLASAFFAPKITDVSKTFNDAPDPNINVGWRKLIRLKALNGSTAQQKGVAAGFLLFNKFQGEHQLNPFRPADNVNESKATQLILTRADGSSLKRPVYFFVFGPLSEGSKLITFLKASFDERGPDTLPKDDKYHVPHACAQCHGGEITDINDNSQYERLKLNYLDTDHWFDRLNDDFAVVKTMPFGVLFDGGKDETKQEFADAFKIIRRLNREIREQNYSVEPKPTPVPPSFQLRAVDKWLELHDSSTSHQDLFSRALPNRAGALPWNATATPDKDLLPLLNQYCFRCHSSLEFNIFDRPAVAGRRGLILGKLHKTPVTNKDRMPQDRNLDCTQKWRQDKQRIHTLVCGFNPTAPCPTPTPPTEPCPTPSPTPTPP